MHHHDHHDHTHSPWQPWLKTGLMLALGIYFAYNIASGNLANYINVRFAWLSYIAAALFFLLGAFGLVELLRRHANHHSHLSWPAIGIIALPLLLGTLIPSRPLGAEAVGGNISLTAASASNITPVTGDPLKWNVLDWLRAFNRNEDLTSFNGQEANLIGFVYREPDFAENQFMVARFTISCCVADSSAIGLPVAWNEAANLPEGGWVQVQGAFEVGAFGEDTMPILQASSVETVEQPEHPYLYP